MTDKEKVLATCPDAFTQCWTTTTGDWWVVFLRGVTGQLGSGPTESEAWANAAKEFTFKPKRLSSTF